jgi:hypothetical protein
MDRVQLVDPGWRGEMESVPGSCWVSCMLPGPGLYTEDRFQVPLEEELGANQLERNLLKEWKAPHRPSCLLCPGTRRKWVGSSQGGRGEAGSGAMWVLGTDGEGGRLVSPYPTSSPASEPVETAAVEGALS